MEKTTTPCAACKHLRRKCTKDCVFAPYFSTEKQENYEAVHKVFGASHVARFINDLHPSKREIAMDTLSWEAQVRLKDPVNGCTAIMRNLHLQLKDLEHQLAIVMSELASYRGVVPKFVPSPPIAYPVPPPIAYQQIHHNPIMSATPNILTAQDQLQDEAHRRHSFESTQTVQRQQTQETQTHHNESDDKKLNGPP